MLSIITINYADVLGLKKTLASVACQSVVSIEHVVVDGGSTDGSVDVIREYAASAPYQVKWVSEPDKGIYNAMNKGIKMATGEYIQILNSGDCIAAPDVTERMLKAVEENSRPDILYGNMLRVDAYGKVVGKSGRVEYSLRQYYTATLNHDCAYIKRCLFNEYGLYDEDLKIVSDWKWYLQVIGLGRVIPVYSNIDVTLFDCGGISEKNLALRNKERRKVLEDLLPPALLADYDSHSFEIEQVKRLQKRYLWKPVWFLERCLFKLEKWRILKP